MSSASKVTQLHSRMAERNPRIQITNIVEQIPEPEFDSVGAELRAHRNRKGHELEMAGRVLRIKTIHIQAIEDSNYAALPGKAYAIGFVRSYAEYLGLDPDDCIRRFKAEYSAAMDPKPVEGDDVPRSKSASGLAFPEARDDVRLPHGSMIILGAMLVLMIWGGWYITSKSEQAFTDASTGDAELEQFEAATADIAAIPTPQVRPAPQQTATVSAADPASTETETAGSVVDGAAAENMDAAEVASTETNSSDDEAVAALEGAAPDEANPIAADDAATVGVTPATGPSTDFPLNEGANLPEDREPQVFGMQNYDARVIVRARADSWVRIEDLNTGVLFEATMQRGDSYRVPNRANIILATRNAGALEMLVDGASAGPIGRIGEAVLEQPLDADALAASLPAQP